MIGAGYEDGNDADALRRDPIFKLALDRLPAGEELCSPGAPHERNPSSTASNRQSEARRHSGSHTPSRVNRSSVNSRSRFSQRLPSELDDLVEDLVVTRRASTASFISGGARSGKSRFNIF
jgi:hypothetical protein